MTDAISLRDHFAATMDRDEFDDLSYKHMSLEAKELISGVKKPAPANEASTREDRVALQVEHVKWELSVRAAVRFIWADAMLAHRGKNDD